MAAAALTSSPPCSSFPIRKTTTTTAAATVPRILEPCCLLSSSLPSSTLHFPYPNNLSCFLSLSPFSLSLSKSHSSKPFASSSSSSSSSSSTLWPTSQNKSRLSSLSTFALVDEEEPLLATLPAADPIIGEDDDSLDDDDGSASSNNLLKPCEVYVCNLPRSCGISELHDLFKPYGTVQSVEVSRNAETGISRGCGYVIMSSMDEAKAAIAALDGSDVGGREMRVRFSVDMSTERKYLEPLNSKPKKNLIFETPYKIYVGNLAWPVKPEDLKNLFSQFGTVNSSRVLHDRKGGKNRVYGFLSFSSAAECKAAMCLNGTEFFGRTMLIREVSKKNDP